jgi:hypothetical protein
MASIYDPFRITVKPALKSKLEEFALFGYNKITEEDLWAFLVNKKWKKDKEVKRLYQLVNDVLEVKVGEYMNYATVGALKSPNFFEGEGMDELEKLL